MLQAVLKQGVSLAFEPGDRMSVIHEAINYGRDDVEVLDILLAHGADINSPLNHKLCPFGDYTPIHWVVGAGKPDLLRWFIKHGADLNAADKNGLTPFNRAIQGLGCREDDSEDLEEMFLADECKLLLEAGVDLTTPNNDGNTPLHYAALNKLTKIVQFLLNNGCPVNVKNKDEQTPLHIAVKSSSSEIVDVLLKHGMDPDDKVKGETPLHKIASSSRNEYVPEDLKIANLLINAGAKVDATDVARTGVPESVQFTALVQAASNNNIQMVEFLVAKGAAIDFMNGLALREATFFEYDDIVEYLLSQGAKPDLQDSETLDGAIHVAASERYVTGTKILHRYKANIELCNIDGETALCVAIRRWADDVAQYLIESGANVNHVDKYGNTPLFLARRKGNEEIEELLIKTGAKIDG
jgi:ankyrin repeat protein